MKKQDFTDLNYQLGQYVGEYIVAKHLLTLSTDMITSNRVVDVSDEDSKKHEIIENELDKTYTFFGGDGDSTKQFEAFKQFNHELARKYLPEKLDCLVPTVHPTDMELFKDGITHSIWDCDMSWYDLCDDFYKSNGVGSWADYIFLKLSIDE